MVLYRPLPLLLFFITAACRNDMIPPVVLLLCIQCRGFFSSAAKVLTDRKSKVWILCSNLIEVYCTWVVRKLIRQKLKLFRFLYHTVTLTDNSYSECRIKHKNHC